NKYTFALLQKLTPNFDWTAYFTAIKMPSPDHYLVLSPEFMKNFDVMLKTRSLDEWKTYLRWSLLNLSSENLPLEFRQANFEFYGKTLTDRKAMRPRWKVCADAADRDLGQALGRAYVARAFPPSSKERMLKLVKAIEQALDENIES